MTVSISGTIDCLQDKYALSPALQGLVISSIMIGGVIGAGFSGFLSDKYGRRRSADRRLHAARQLVRADAGARRPAREPHPDLRLRPSSVQSDGRSAGRGGNWHCGLGL